ncbi:hypothetical protein LX83_003571 [Goodfellowiella coeruleoviolacea]|uniref:DUF5753 domain-containing protein n=1 Tax=Goodfellowiella coeruleoviolacea TaxID=334858 RepID=A0AAE3KHR5_9PSEU|nr:hypothetical protein [Goodfellowiella coeruleoviolacea]
MYLEQLKDGTYVEEAEEVDEYILNFRSLADLALSPQESAKLIAEIRDTWQ